MNKELIKTYFKEFNHWLNGGKLQAKFVNDPWEEAPEDIFSYSAVNFLLVVDDEYVEFRKALAEGKVIQYYECVYQHEMCVNLDRYDWLDWKSATPSSSFTKSLNYRIKPEEPKFKVGDWVIHNGKYKRVTKAVDGYIDSLDNAVAVIMKEESLELWKPKDKDYFWYKNDLVKFHETQTNYGTLLMSTRGCSYYPSEENFEDYYEPFIGQLPTYIKDSDEA